MHQVARAGLLAISVAIVTVLFLELSGDVDLARRTISEHGLGDTRPVFTMAVALIALGSIAIGAALARRGSWPGLLALAGWAAGLLVVAWFPKHDWSVGPSVGGGIHRTASMVAFACLPLAVLLLARPWWRGTMAARVAAVLGFGSAGWVAGIGAMIVYAAANDLRWWRVMPLGVVERGLVYTEVAALVALGVWAAVRRPEEGQRRVPTL